MAQLSPPPDVHWAGKAPCDAALDLYQPALPGGSVNVPDANARPGRHAYKTSSGALIVTMPAQVGVRDVDGQDFAELFRNIRSMRALHIPTVGKRFPLVRLAQIQTSMSMSVWPMPVSGDADAPVKANPDRTTIRLNPRIELIRWVGYDDAPSADRKLWDRARCEHIHHEIGHLLVTAQVIEEELPTLFTLRADDDDDLSIKRSDWFDAMSDKSSERQEQYHELIAEMGPEIADSAPYLELDFPWLNNGSAAKDPNPISTPNDSPPSDSPSADLVTGDPELAVKPLTDEEPTP